MFPSAAPLTGPPVTTMPAVQGAGLPLDANAGDTLISLSLTTLSVTADSKMPLRAPVAFAQGPPLAAYEPGSILLSEIVRSLMATAMIPLLDQFAMRLLVTRTCASMG